MMKYHETPYYIACLPADKALMGEAAAGSEPDALSDLLPQGGFGFGSRDLPAAAAAAAAHAPRVAMTPVKYQQVRMGWDAWGDGVCGWCMGEGVQGHLFNSRFASWHRQGSCQAQARDYR